jgi:hypothetical protein
MWGASTNSTAIDRAPGARSKSDEKCEAPLLLLEISSTLCEIERRLCCTSWDPESTSTLQSGTMRSSHGSSSTSHFLWSMTLRNTSLSGQIPKFRRAKFQSDVRNDHYCAVGTSLATGDATFADRFLHESPAPPPPVIRRPPPQSESSADQPLSSKRILNVYHNATVAHATS